MQFLRHLKTGFPSVAVLATVCSISPSASAQNQSQRTSAAAVQGCPNNDSGLKLPAGFFVPTFSPTALATLGTGLLRRAGSFT
jgi:hypothetical protein